SLRLATDSRLRSLGWPANSTPREPRSARCPGPVGRNEGERARRRRRIAQKRIEISSARNQRRSFLALAIGRNEFAPITSAFATHECRHFGRARRRTIDGLRSPVGESLRPLTLKNWAATTGSVSHTVSRRSVSLAPIRVMAVRAPSVSGKLRSDVVASCHAVLMGLAVDRKYRCARLSSPLWS